MQGTPSWLRLRLHEGHRDRRLSHERHQRKTERSLCVEPTRLRHHGQAMHRRTKVHMQIFKIADDRLCRSQIKYVHFQPTFPIFRIVKLSIAIKLDKIFPF